MSDNFCVRNFKSLLFAATIAEFAEFAVHLSNNVIAGQLIGEEGISALHLVVPLLSFLLFVTNIVCIGTYICYSFEIGRFNREKAAQYFGQGIILTILIGVIMTGISIIFRNNLIELLAGDHTVNEYVFEYFRFLPVVILLQPITLLLAQMVYVDGDKTVSAAAYICQILGNIIFSWVLCKKIGIAGVSLGTVISFILTLLVLSIHFFRKINTIRFKWYADYKDMLRIAKYSVVKSSSIFFFSLFTAIINTFMLSQGEEEYLPVFAVVMDMVELMVIFDGVEVALAPMFATLHAEHNTKMLGILVRESLKIAFIEGIVMTVLVLLFAKNMAILFGLHDAEKITIAASCLRIMSLSFCAAAVIKLLAGYYLHMEYVKLSIAVCSINGIAAPLIFVVFFVYVFGAVGLGVGMFFSPIFSLFMTALIVYILYKKENFPYLIDKTKDKNIYMYDISLSQDTVMEITDKIEHLLKENNISGKSLIWVRLFSEEIGMMILEKNINKEISAQYTVDLNSDEIKLIIRDDGVLFDITDTDSKISSLRSFVVSGIMEKQEIKFYQITTGYNRNAFKFPKA